jgi:hypothetical protein
VYALKGKYLEYAYIKQHVSGKHSHGIYELLPELKFEGDILSSTGQYLLSQYGREQKQLKNICK